MLPTRRVILGSVAATASSCILWPIKTYADDATVPLVGRKVRWLGTLTGPGWFGGNVDQIKNAVAELEAKNANQAFLQVVKDMIPVAEEYDIYCTDFAEGQTHSDTITVLATNTVNEAAKDFSDATYCSELAKGLAEPPLTGASGARPATSPAQTGTQVVFVNQATTGGKPALSIAIRADLEDKTAFYVVYQLVILGDGRWHTFNLTVDADHYNDRLNDLNQMLATVRYES